MRIVLHDGHLFHQVVVGEVGTHPRQAHHGGWQFDVAFDGGDPVPDFPAFAQVSDAPVARWRLYQDEGIRMSAGPDLDRHLA
jgi:hypothetical protein